MPVAQIGFQFQSRSLFKGQHFMRKNTLFGKKRVLTKTHRFLNFSQSAF